ncbi:MAG: hypothetical protein AB1609_22465 [Bacillota bacterium]
MRGTTHECALPAALLTTVVLVVLLFSRGESPGSGRERVNIVEQVMVVVGLYVPTFLGLLIVVFCGLAAAEGYRRRKRRSARF